MSEINYNNLPEKVGELWEDVKTIKELLKKRDCCGETIFRGGPLCHGGYK